MMKISWLLGVLAAAAMACLPANADTTIALDNGVNSQNFEWDNPGIRSR